MTATIVNGREIAKQLRKKVAREISRFTIPPCITTLMVGHESSSDLYLKLRDAACKEVGIHSSHQILEKSVSEKDVIQKIEELNTSNKIHGILIQYPVPNHISQERLMSAIVPQKDVEGLHPFNMGNTLLGREHLIPCTPQAVLEILHNHSETLQGKDVTIVSHSNIVGKPLATLLLNRNASVAICHVFSKDISIYTKQADILISATGVPKLITKDHVKNNAIVIDVGIIKTKDGICGDVDFESVKEQAKTLTPVPGGVGPVTIACSLKNMVKTYRNCLGSK